MLQLRINDNKIMIGASKSKEESAAKNLENACVGGRL
jgi:hypothetical protein